MEIRLYPDPVLRKGCKRLAVVSEETRALMEDMAQTMYEAKGVGLAAPQVGVLQEVIVVDAEDGLIALANPMVVKEEGRSVLEEGCLSLPGITLEVRRAERVVVRGLNERGEMVSVEAEGVKAHALQHEIDHLKGILIIDYVGWRKRFSLRPKLRELVKKYGKY